MKEKAIQDSYPFELNHCYGCGPFNAHGLRLRSYSKGNETVATFTPKPYHTAVPGFVYGGLIASIIDCHGIGTAVAEAYRIQHREMGTEPPIRYVTAALRVSYCHPTPIDGSLELRGCVKEVKDLLVVKLGEK